MPDGLLTSLLGFVWLGALTQIISKYPGITTIYLFHVFIFTVSLAIVGFQFIKLRQEKRLEAKKQKE